MGGVWGFVGYGDGMVALGSQLWRAWAATVDGFGGRILDRLMAGDDARWRVVFWR